MWLSCVAIALLLSAGGPARAQSGGSESSAAGASGWTYELTPYFWGPGLEGTTRGGNLPTTSIDTDFSDIWDVLDFAAMGVFEARKGRWGFSLDMLHLSISDSGTSSMTGAGPAGPTITAGSEVEIKQTMLALTGMYRLMDARTSVDLVAGLRYMNVDVEADIDASLFGAAGAGAAARVSRGADKDWTDPLIGVRIQHALAEGWTLAGYLDAGGFGVGSDLTWQAVLGATYAQSRTIAWKFGYRYMSIDYDSGGFRYDVTMQGPYAGVGIRF
jgi:hypothetical protein